MGRDRTNNRIGRGSCVDRTSLPFGATPIDFAYHVHTDLGHNCVGALVNGKLSPLNTKLKNGDVVEIRKSKIPRGPSLDWLNPDLGYLTTASAHGKVRTWFRRQERGANVQRGRDQIRREIRRIGVEMTEVEVAQMMGYASPDDLAEALGTGQVTPGKIGERLNAGSAQAAPPKPVFHGPKPSKNGSSGIVVMGTSNVLTRIPQCCNPVYGDEIVGYLTRGRGVTVHRVTCPNLRSEVDPDRVVQVAWGHASSMYPARLSVDAYDRVGLIRDITNVVSSEHVNIHSMTSVEDESSDQCTVSLTVYTTGVEQLSRLFARLEAISGVHTVSRVNEVAGGSSARK